MTMDQATKPPVQLTGSDGNAFSVIGKCRKAARSAGWTDSQWDAVRTEAMDGDYNHLLATFQKYFEVS